MTQKVPKKSALPARPVKGAKQEAAAPPDYSSFLTGLKGLNKEDLIKKVTSLNAAATSGWVPRAIAFGELYNREGLAALPARQRTRRLREIASQTRVSLNTARQDVRLRDAFLHDETSAAKWFACEPIEREAFVTALAEPETLEYAYEAFIRGAYNRAEFRRYVKAQVAGPGPETEKGGKPQRIRGLPPEVREALEELKSRFPELDEAAILLKALEALKQQEEAETRGEGKKKKPSKKSLRKHGPKSPPRAGDEVAAPSPSLFAADAGAAGGGRARRLSLPRHAAYVRDAAKGDRHSRVRHRGPSRPLDD